MRRKTKTTENYCSHVSAACRNVAEPETDAPHLGVSLGGLEVDGGVTKDAGNSCEEKQKPLRTNNNDNNINANGCADHQHDMIYRL